MCKVARVFFVQDLKILQFISIRHKDHGISLWDIPLFLSTASLTLLIVPSTHWAAAQHLQETCLTFDSFGRGQQQMVLRQNVSYDVYGTFCVESEGHTQQLTQTWHATQAWLKTVLFRINTSEKVKVIPTKKVVLKLIHCKSQSGSQRSKPLYTQRSITISFKNTKTHSTLFHADFQSISVCKMFLLDEMAHTQSMQPHNITISKESNRTDHHSESSSCASSTEELMSNVISCLV